MAVENKYVDADVASSGYGPSATQFGTDVTFLKAIVTVAAADDDGSIYRFARALPADIIIDKIELVNTAITSGTAYDVGVYDTPSSATVSTGLVVDKDCFANNIDMSSAASWVAPKNGMAAVVPADANKRLYEIAGHTAANKRTTYDLAITADTVGSAAGEICVMVMYHAR